MERKRSDNAMNVIYPYKLHDTWAFDDEAHGLVAEPFVLGIPIIINEFLKKLKVSGEKLKFTFSKNEFPGYQSFLTKEREDFGGAWYRSEDPNLNSGWLCPATLLYFSDFPEKIYFKVEALT